MPMWNPWRGCKKCSDGCLHCYIHKGDAKRGVDTGEIVRSKDFYKPIEKLKNGSYRMKAGWCISDFPRTSSSKKRTNGAGNAGP